MVYTCSYINRLRMALQSKWKNKKTGKKGNRNHINRFLKEERKKKILAIFTRVFGIVYCESLCTHSSHIIYRFANTGKTVCRYKCSEKHSSKMYRAHFSAGQYLLVAIRFEFSLYSRIQYELFQWLRMACRIIIIIIDYGIYTLHSAVST